MKKWTFKAKLIFLCLFLAFITGVVGGTSYWGLNRVIASYGKAADISLPNMTNLGDMRVQYREIRINLRTLGIPGLSKEQGKESVEKVLHAIEMYEKADKLYTSNEFQPGEKELYEEVDANWEHFKAIGGRALSMYNSQEPDHMEKLIAIFLKDCPEAAGKFTEAMNKLVAYQKDFAQKATDEAHAAASKTISLMLAIGLLGILAGLSIGWIFSSSISKTLGRIASSLGSNAEQVASASSQIASSSQQLSQATTEQAASLEETAAALEEITSMIARAAESAKSSSDSSKMSHEKAEEGRSAVDNMMTSMQEISESNEAIMAQIADSNEKMTEIVKVIQEIGNKTKVINEIVFQTKLLSFNASVEAARAGEHGKGFAVVAEEVGNLAQMSGNAAKEISDLLSSSVSRVEGIVEETKSKVESLFGQGKQKVQAGLGMATQCSEVLNEIVQNVSKVASLAQEIAQAAQEQTQGVTEINKAMGELDSVTQQNSSSSQETATSAKVLSDQSESLKMSVEELLAMVHGGGTPAGHAGAQVIPFPQPSEQEEVSERQTGS